MTEQFGHWPITGHQTAVELFQRAAATGQIGHAYLITGPDGIGRRTLALTFAQALTCTSTSEPRPCGTCSACNRVVRGLHPDVTTLNLETQAVSSDSRNTRISIESVRNLRSSISLRPLEANWRVAVIEDVELFSRDAFDALLKTLEEPPPFVVLILIATEPEAVPETIRSRCRPVPLEPLVREDVVRLLRDRGVDAEQATLIAGLTRGRVAAALALAADSESLTRRREVIEAALGMIENPLTALGSARRLSETFRRGQRPNVEAELDTLLGLWRDILLSATGCTAHIVNQDFAPRITALAEQWTLPQIHNGLKATYEALSDLNLNVQPRLALNRMVTQWPAPGRLS